MSDDLVKRLREAEDESFVETLHGKAADRIEELEAKLAKAVGALERIQDGSYGKLAAIARATLAELKDHTKDSTQENSKGFDGYRNYRENNPPVGPMSNPGDKNYEV